MLVKLQCSVKKILSTRFSPENGLQLGSKSAIMVKTADSGQRITFGSLKFQVQSQN
jgi:hypothetical protein